MESMIKTLKYEEVYRNDYESLTQAHREFANYLLDIYDHRRLHSAIAYHTPVEYEQCTRPPHGAHTTHEFSKASGNLLRGAQNSRTESPPSSPSGHATSSSRLFLSRLLSGRARLRLRRPHHIVKPKPLK
jgi:hypothetical protein